MDPLGIGLAAAAVSLFGIIGYVGRGLIEQSRQNRAREAAEDEASIILDRAKEEAERQARRRATQDITTPKKKKKTQIF